jgi:succinyl-diaminopimelate desuccinylase
MPVIAEHRSPVALTAELLARQSISPNDAGCQQVLSQRLAKVGFKIESHNSKGVTNTWASHGSGAPLVVLAGHTDVVPPGPIEDWKYGPFAQNIVNGYLYGRGAVDMKGGVACLSIAAENFITRFPNHTGTLALLITSDEELRAQAGTAHVLRILENRNVKIDYTLIAEPTSHHTLGDEIKTGRRGSLNCDLRIEGRQGHVAYPNGRHNPIHMFSELVHTLHSHCYSESGLFAGTDFSATQVNSGSGEVRNLSPRHLTGRMNFRYPVTTNADAIQAEVQSIITAAGYDFKTEWTNPGQPYQTTTGALTAALVIAVQERMQITPAYSCGGGMSDGRFFHKHGAEVVELGLLNETIHCANERVKTKDLVALTNIYERALEILLRA